MIDSDMKRDYDLCLFSHSVFMFLLILLQILKCHFPFSTLSFQRRLIFSKISFLGEGYILRPLENRKHSIRCLTNGSRGIGVEAIQK